jgi:hypothetical protein
LERLNQEDKAIKQFEAFLNIFPPVYGSIAPAVQSKVSALKQRLKQMKYGGPVEKSCHRTVLFWADGYER